MLSCAQKVTVITKTKGAEYVGGVIDNSGLDKAIIDDLTPDKYPLEEWSPAAVEGLTGGHERGTIIFFEDIKEGIKNTLHHLNKQIALYFRFSLLDESFNIYLNNEKVDYMALKDLAEKTQYIWKLNSHDEPYLQLVAKTQAELKGKIVQCETPPEVQGFIASVRYPRNLKILTTDDRVSIDLFVNGRLRERDVLKHIPTARIVESYLYGQIHFNALDDQDDRFTSSREGIVADDPKFRWFLGELDKVMKIIIENWDEWRLEGGEDGDPDNKRITKRERKSRELFGAVSKDYSLGADQKNRPKVDAWVAELADDAQFNFTSYAECFISENLTRKYINEKPVPLSPQAQKEGQELRDQEAKSKGLGNISVDIRKIDSDLSYLGMTSLAALADKNTDTNKASLFRDAKEYKPMRDAVAHTALLTDAAKSKLTAV